MKLSDRIKRWWSPAEWKDEHPVETEGGPGHPLSEEERAEDRRIPGPFPESTADYSDET